MSLDPNRRGGRGRRDGVRPRLEGLEPRCLLATFTVCVLDDDGPGSLRGAIEQANADPDHDIIRFEPGLTGTITLQTKLPDLTTDLAMVGPGSEVLTLERSQDDEAPAFRIITVGEGVTVSLAGLTLAGGLATAGGGVANAGTLVLSEVEIRDNRAGFELADARGGGVSNTGVMTIVDAILRENEARGLNAVGGGGDGFGGAIHNAGTMELVRTTIVGNAAAGGMQTIGSLNPGTGRGGGILNSGSLTVTASTLDGNVADAGGGIDNDGTLTLDGSMVVDNAATGGLRSAVLGAWAQGGGIVNSGLLRVVDSSFSRNEARSSGFLGAAASGGALANVGTAAILGSAFEDNRADSQAPGGPTSFASAEGGAVRNAGPMTIIGSSFARNRVRATDGITADARGGAVSSSEPLSITESVFEENRVDSQGIRGGIALGGAIASNGPLALSASTLVGNAAEGRGGFGPSGSGGALVQGQSGSATVVNTTISGNRALSGGGISTDGDVILAHATIADNEGGGVVAFTIPPLTPRRVAVVSSLFGSNPGGSIVNDGAEVVSMGGNVFADAPGLELAPSDRAEVDPRLGPLGDNGGPTPTRALLPGSPAIDAAVPVLGVTADQRGIPRPSASAPDSGAFEAEVSAEIVATPDPPMPSPGQPVTVRLTLTDADGLPLAGVPAAIQVVSGPNAGIAGPIALTDLDGRLVFSYEGEGGLGTDAVIASAIQPGGSTVVSTPASVSWPALPPVVTGLHRQGFHARPTRLLLSFSEPMDPHRAGSPDGYRLVAPGRDGRLGTADDRAVPIASAVPDPSGTTVTLVPGLRLPLHRAYRLTVIGTPPEGLTSASGAFLDGSGTGRPGSDFVTTFGPEVLDRPTRAGLAGRHSRPPRA
ncbi:choice-of-anchor Q domain-containing protein [Tautonia sp. JC769]|uniref:choice-of-anchor Q domain-containing protein n=1 Tax=Tautonia sp. JC769 TaxID=3232135 RepID=UPI003457C873